MPSSKDPIFGPTKKSVGVGWYLLWLTLVVGGLLYLKRPDPREQILENHKLAVEHLQTILRALERWKRNDYDGNGRRDYPLAPLQVLHDTTLVNGRSIELIPEALGLADLRFDAPVPQDGYVFTLSHPDHEWPRQGSSDLVSIFAKPHDPGRSGSCSFYVDTAGVAWYTNVALTLKVPPWPDRRSIEAGVWLPLEGFAK